MCVGVAYFALALLMTYPLVLEFNDNFGGYHGDILPTLWNRWWLREALQKGLDPYFTPYLFYPGGAYLLFHNMGWFNILTGLALGPFFGEVGSYNAIILANFTLCGLGAYALIRYLGEREIVAFVGGLVYAFFPYHMSNILTQPEIANVQWVPLYVLYLMEATRGKGPATGLLAGLFLGLTALAHVHLLTMVGMLTALWLAYSLACERAVWSWRSIRNLAIIGLVLLALAGPFFFPMAAYFVKGGELADTLTEQDDYRQTDVLAYLVPSRYHPLLGLPYLFYGKHFYYNRNWQPTPGYVVLFLLGYAFVRRSRRRAFWAFLALVLCVLALGPYLRVAGRIFWEIPLPYHLVSGLPVIRALRASDRFNGMLALPVSVLAAFSLSDLLAKVQRRLNVLFARGAAVLFGCLILFEYLVVPFPTMRPQISSFYEALRSEDGQFAVVDVPTGWAVSRYYLYYQMEHGHPIVEGHISRPIGGTYRFIGQVPLLTRVDEYQSEWKLDFRDVSRQLSPLADADVRYLIVHKDFVKEEGHLPAWLDWITLQPRYEDEQIIVYSTRPEYGRDFEWERDLGAEVGIIRAKLPMAGEFSQGSVFEAEIRWGSRGAPAQNLAVEVALVSEENGQIVQRTHRPILEEWPTGQWPAGTVVIDRYRFQIDPMLPGGVYSVRVSLLDAETLAPVGEQADLGSIVIHELPRSFDPPTPAVVLDVSFGEDLRLVGYDLELDAEELTLVLHWQALRRMDDTWKFFVHVFDPDTGAVVAQADVMPRNWAYPTNWWAEGEYVGDPISVSMEGVPSGTFGIAVGVYHPDSGERLVTSLGEDRLVLPQEVSR
ncbi:MAG: hypothetical protein JW918_10315 [Anaerolineae bacterium]|nr:hypothetical protein [Anaerolineae bacterium]